MVVLTGDLDDMVRWDAFEAIAAVGGTPQKGVTLKTTMLIVAGHNRIPANYDPSLGTGKEALQDPGCSWGRRVGRRIGVEASRR